MINLSQEDIDKLVLTANAITDAGRLFMDKHDRQKWLDLIIGTRICKAQVKAVFSSPILSAYIDKQVKEARKKEREEIGEALYGSYTSAGKSWDMAEAISLLQFGQSLKGQEK